STPREPGCSFRSLCLPRWKNDDRWVRLRYFHGQVPRRRADLIQREVEHRVALHSRPRAHGNADADPRPDADPTAATRAADAAPDAGAATAVQGRLLDRLRPHRLLSGRDDLGVL